MIPETASKLADALRDRYLLDRELGRGGMATVYLAQDLKHGRPVALKVLHAALAASLGPERFQREIKTVARLQHPHILTVYDSGESAGQLWFSMPFVEGESLRDRLRREQQLPVDVALRIATDAARALQCAHEHGIIHRDIKPENLLLTKDGSTLVADFGIARALSGGDDRLTDTGISVGTPAYMSPEQAVGDRMLDARTDVYALGAVLYEMLAGEAPFTGPTAQAVIAKRFYSEATPLRTVRPSVPPHVEHAVTRALARVPTDRFASASELARALEQDPSVNTIHASTPPAARVRSVPAAFRLLGLGMLIGLGILFAWTRERDGPAAGETSLRRVAVLPFENLGEKDKAYFADGITDEIRGKLATVAGLQVTARTSSTQYRQTMKSPREIGRELGVDFLLTGTVRWDRVGTRNRVRVSPELVQAASSSTRWQQSFDAPLTDVFQVQADVAERVARELGVALGAGQRQHLEERPTGDLGAYDLYLKGRYAWHQRTAPGLDQARRLLEQAIRLDPAFAPAHAALADVYTVLGLWSDLPPDQTYPRAKAAAVEALKLDSTLAGPYAVLGDINAMYEWDWPSAERNFRRSLALDPNNANTHHWYSGHYLLTVGRNDDAVAMARRARELDPLSLTINGELGRTLYSANHPGEAAAQLREVLALDSTFVMVNEYLGTVYLSQGRAAEAVSLFQHAVDPAVRHSIPTALFGHALAKAGRRRESEALLRELLERQSKGYVCPTAIALLTAGLGDTVETFAWLERAAKIHDPFLIYNFVNDPMLEKFRRDQRGAAILRAMGLPDTR